MGLCLATFPTLARAAPEERVARGMRSLQMQGCVTCHSLDGSVSAGPSFAGRFGELVEVRSEGALRQVRFDRAYLERSLRAPNADVAAGFAPDVMPRFALTAEQTEAIATALASLRHPPPPPCSPLSPFAVIGAVVVLLGGLYLWRRKLSRARSQA